MTLSDFIESNLARLMKEWEEFARRAQPDDVDLDRDELRDWADGLLVAIATEMRTPESDAEVERRSKTLRPSDAPAITEAARAHAMDRLAQGFNLDQMISEYRSLRTSVALQWQRECASADAGMAELVRFDEALDHALAESVRKYSDVLERARDLFVGALSHDMRTPLGTISVTADALLASSDRLDGHCLQGAVRIRNAAKRIGEMLQDLLDFTHTRLGGRLPVTVERTNLGEVLSAVAEELRTLHPDRAIELDCEAGLTGEFDPGRIGQMLSNLLSNALKYGRDATTVHVHARRAGDEIVFVVRNEGDPISRNQRRTIFEPLVRGRARTEPDFRKPDGGLGLGLYIARQIAEAHGGSLRLKSSTEDATVFEARVSISPPPASRARKTPANS